VKLRQLAAYADELGAPWIATGHYARAEGGALFRGVEENDQSYMLCRLPRSLLPRLILPLGGYAKPQVRALAREWDLPAASRPDSMEICFIPDGDYAAWIEGRGEAPPPGDFLYQDKAVGRHGGIHRCTVGQRRGLHVSLGKRIYVSEIRPDTDTVVLRDGDGLYAGSLHVRDVNWLADAPAGPFPCRVRIRHSRKGLTPALVSSASDGGAKVVFEAPVRAPTPGQSAVFYDGDRLLGGGFIR
jgi:tRNA-specific 2-thiouridylase